MRIGLLDPRWVEQRDRHLQDRMNQDTVYAPGKSNVPIYQMAKSSSSNRVELGL